MFDEYVKSFNLGEIPVDFYSPPVMFISPDAHWVLSEPEEIKGLLESTAYFLKGELTIELVSIEQRDGLVRYEVIWQDEAASWKITYTALDGKIIEVTAFDGFIS